MANRSTIASRHKERVSKIKRIIKEGRKDQMREEAKKKNNKRK